MSHNHTPQLNLPIIFDPSTGQFSTRFSRLVDAEAQEIAFLSARAIPHCYGEAFKRIMEKDARENGGSLGREHERLIGAVRNIERADVYTASPVEKFAATLARQGFDEYMISLARDEAAAKARNQEDPAKSFLGKVEELLSSKYSGDRSKWKLASNEIAEAYPELIQDYIFAARANGVPPYSTN